MGPKYIVGFAAAVCLVCSILVSGSAVALKERQETNKILDRQTKVLVVAGLLPEGASVTPQEVKDLFKANVNARLIDLKTGKYIKASAAELDKFEYKKLISEMKSGEPRTVAARVAGLTKMHGQQLIYEIMAGKTVEMVVLPIEGKGLWSTLYGFLAVAADGNTVRGITFYQHGETPGLGGEIDNPAWKALWPGKKAYAADGKAGLQVIKGQAKAGSPHDVDGLSGATLTGIGVSKLVRFWLGDFGFKPFLKNFVAGGKS